MIELNTASAWTRIHGITLLEPLGFGEKTGRPPYLRDLVDETTFHRCMWRSCFKVDDMATWSAWANRMPDVVDNNALKEGKARAYRAHCLWRFLLSALFIKHRGPVGQEIT